MATYDYTPGLGHVGSYQVSGKPFVSSSITVPVGHGVPIQVSFPSVTRAITVRNDTATVIRVGFSHLGISGSVATNYFTLAEDVSFQEDIKASSVFLISNDANPGEATIIASLTGIPANSITNNWSGSVGVG